MSSPSSPPSLDREVDTVVLDIDGTLVDSVYAHAWSWIQAFRGAGVHVPGWRVHQAIGMGGDRLVAAVSSDTVERQMGDQVRAAQKDLYAQFSEKLMPTQGATDLLNALKERGLKVVLASSGSRDDTERSIQLLQARSIIDGAVSGDDADATKPDTEPIRRAIDAVGGEDALVIGDATWDMESATRAGFPALAVRTGGIAPADLIASGAMKVLDDPETLVASLDATLVMAAQRLR
jgi:phosphoglycolate phosphatase